MSVDGSGNITLESRSDLYAVREIPTFSKLNQISKLLIDIREFVLRHDHTGTLGVTSALKSDGSGFLVGVHQLGSLRIASSGIGIGKEPGAGVELDVLGDIAASGGITASTINTGQGANELYDMDQNVLTTSAVTFASVNTGQGNNELYDMDQNVLTTSAVTFASVDTGQGPQELYGMAKDLLSGGGITITGGGNNTLYGPDGDITVAHANTSSQASVNNSNGTVIQDITLDTYGHMTGLTSYNLDSRYYTESEINTWRSTNLDQSLKTTSDVIFNSVSATDIYAGDLHLKNERGNWTMIEEDDYLTIRNNKTGKMFKLSMEEIT